MPVDVLLCRKDMLQPRKSFQILTLSHLHPYFAREFFVKTLSGSETFTDFGVRDYNLPFRENLTMLLLNPVVFPIPQMGYSLTGSQKLYEK